jgi:hypothetical protein
MSAQIITVDELTEYANRSVSVSSFSAAQLEDAVVRATDRIRQAALNDYTAASFELLTSSNAPDELREITLAIALGVLTRGDGSRPLSIDTAVTDAAKRVGYIAGGKTHYDSSPNAVLVKVVSGAESSVTARGVAARSFDSFDDFSEYSIRNQKI